MQKAIMSVCDETAEDDNDGHHINDDSNTCFVTLFFRCLSSYIADTFAIADAEIFSAYKNTQHIHTYQPINQPTNQPTLIQL